jgi:hypothetical protein
MFIAREQAEFELGKQHLANMMGIDPENMTQEIVIAGNGIFGTRERENYLPIF